MSASATRADDFFLARQPILNREQGLFAYELLFRRATTADANVFDDLSATAAVIAHASELGMENVLGGLLGFVNVDATVMLSDFVKFLPHDKVVLEILETVKGTENVIERIAELTKAGYTFALDDVVEDSVDVQKLMPLVAIVKIDIMGMAYDRLADLSSQFKAARKKLLAEKVETLEQFQTCLGLGFDYFQGYYFAKPIIMTGKKLSSTQLKIMQLMGLLVSDADNSEIESSIKQDAALGLTLLRLVNTPALGVVHSIDSIGQALTVLGRRQLQRWLQILLYAEPGKASHSASPLLRLAVTRGKFLELITQKLYENNRSKSDIAFTVGIMSLMDTLFSATMETILEKFAVTDDVRDALLSRVGIYGDMLKLAECMERIEERGELLMQTMDALQLSSNDVNAMQMEAFNWSEKVARGAC